MSTPGNRRRRSRSPRRGRLLFNVLIFGAFLVSAVLFGLALLERERGTTSDSAEFPGDELATVAVFDVGQALSAAVVTGDDYAMVYDFGLTTDGAEEVIAPFLTGRGAQRIDYAILSHPHQDHVGGLPALIDTLQIDRYLDPVIETTNQTYLQSLEIIESEGIPTGIARQGDSYTLGEHAEIEILWPADDLLTEGDEPAINDNSTVVRVDIRDVSVMFTGDIESEAEERLVERYGNDLDVDILQVAHHGSYTSSGEAFLRYADPEIAVIPAGADNQYGHPHDEVIERLRSGDIETYRTDIDGTVLIHTDGAQYEVETIGGDSP